MCDIDNEISIMDVVNRNSSRIKIIMTSGRSYRAVCPFCGGKATMSITPSLNKWNCFLCGENGNHISLEYKLNPEEYVGDNKYPTFIKNMEEFIHGGCEVDKEISTYIKPAKLEDEGYERASDEICSSVYYALVKMLTLKEEHKRDLLKRGFTEDFISKFHIVTSPSVKDKYSIPKKLISMGYNLEHVPPFYKEEGRWAMSVPQSSYLCPAYDGHRGLLEGFQPRLDNPKNGNKYTWLSSTGKPFGASSGTVASILPGEYDKTIVIVEGTLKALCVYCLLDKKVTIVSVPGVQSLKCLDSVLERYEGAYVFEAYDMDKYPTTLAAETEEEIKEHKKAERISHFADVLEEKCKTYGMKVHHLTWNLDENQTWNGKGKGLDDFLLEYENKDLFISYIINKSENYLKLKNT